MAYADKVAVTAYYAIPVGYESTIGELARVFNEEEHLGAELRVTQLADRRCAMRIFFFSSRRRHTRFDCDWSSDVCSSDLGLWTHGRVVSRRGSHLGDPASHESRAQHPNPFDVGHGAPTLTWG